jgi:hypothetical protein
MYQVIINNTTNFFNFLEAAKAFAKASGLWYAIAKEDEGIIFTQDDEIFEGLLE